MPSISHAFQLLSALLIATLPARAQWTTLNLNTAQPLFGLDYRADGNVWIGGFDTVYYSVNSGNAFVKRPVSIPPGIPGLGTYGAIHAFDANTAVVSGFVALGDGEVIQRTTNARVSFSVVHQEQVSVLDETTDIDFTQAPIGVAGGRNGRILRSTDGGVTWTSVLNGSTTDFFSVANAGGSILLAGGDGPLMRSTNNGALWAPINNAEDFYQLDAIPSVAYAARPTGAIFRSLDQGLSWTQVGQFDGAIEALKVVNFSTLYVSREDGLYRSTTSGQYWEIFDLPGYQTVNALDFYDAQNGIAIGNNGYAIRTGNGGGPALPLAAIIPPTGILCTGEPIVFGTTGNPAHTYTWSVNGVPTGSTATFSNVFTAPGDYTVTMVANNGFGNATASTTITVFSAELVNPYTAIANPDTICPNGTTTITLANAQAGTSYQLWQNGVAQENPQIGTGGPLTFTATSLGATTTLLIRGVRTSVCGNSTLDVPVNFTVFNSSPGTTFALATDSLCVPGATSLIIQNTLSPGYSYFYTTLGLPASPVVPGNGGTIEIPLPPITTGLPAQYTFTLRVNYTGLICPATLPNPAVLNVFSELFSISVLDTALVVGQSFDPNSVPGVYNNIQWDFGNGAVPQTFSGANPPVITYTQPGTSNVVVNATLGSGVCAAQRSATITVVPAANTVDLPLCGIGTASGGLYISDMYLDRFNNVYLTGQQHAPIIDHRAFFAMKLDSAGQVLWEHRQPNVGGLRSYGMGITADAEGNAYVTVASVSSSSTVQDMVVPHKNFLIKFDRTGKPVWNIASPTLNMRGVVAGNDDRIWVAGHGSWNGGFMQLASGEGHFFPAAAAQPNAGSAFLFAVDPNGQLLESTTFGRAFHPDSAATGFAINFDLGNTDPIQRYRCDPRIGLAPNGQLLLSGLMAAQRGATTYSFGGTPVLNNAGLDVVTNSVQVFGARYVPGTGFAQAFSVVGGNIDGLQRMELANDGSYRLCGRARQVIIAGNTQHPLGAANADYGFVAKAAANGVLQWHAAADKFEPFDLAVAADGTTHLIAAYLNTGVFPSAGGALAGLVAAGNADRALMRYSDNGILQQVDVTATPQGEIAYRMRPDACGNLHMASVDGLTGAYTHIRAMACATCTDNVKVEVVSTGGCGAQCFSAYDPTSRDVALEALSLADTLYTPAGARDLRVDLSNMGQVTATSIVIDYRINGGAVQSHTWTGSLPYAQRVNGVVIGSPVLGARNHYTIEAWVRHVNGSADQSAWNDSLHIEQVMCSTPIAGTYTLGPVGSEFPSFLAANKVLMACGVSGTTHITVADGTYYDQVALGPISGTSLADTVVFRSASNDPEAVVLYLKRRIPDNFAPWTLLPNASHLTLQQLTLRPSDPIASNVPLVHVRNGCTRVNVLGCVLENLPAEFGFGIFEEGRVSFLRVEDNTVRYGGWGYRGFGDNQAQRDSVIIIRNNRFLDQATNGVFCVNKQSGLRVENNRITSGAASISSLFQYRGLHVGGVDCGPMVVTGNFVRRSGYYASAPGGSANVILGPGGSLPGRSLIANNMFIALNSPEEFFGGLNQITMNHPTAKADVLHNSFNGVVNLSAGTSGLEELVFRNNIVSSNDRVLNLSWNSDNSTFILDNNVYWSSNTALNNEWVRVNFDPLTLAQLTATYGYDAASAVTQPLFIAPDDLHLDTGNTFTCATHPLVPRDIDGDLRGIPLTRQGADDEGVITHLADLPSVGSGFLLHPNPASAGSVNLLFADAASPGAELALLDASGRRVQQLRLTITGRRATLELDPSLPNGSYMVQVSMNGARMVQPLVLLR
ncbi:MAG TPA: PKD domain-containing protein [Flavobacteriales bacterium]|nr:PKD domain-containing protein [Flavobacteriales bacterium]